MKNVRNKHVLRGRLSVRFPLLFVCMLVVLVGYVEVFASSLNTAPPTSPVRLVFVHHSVGQYWLTNSNIDNTHTGGLGIALRDNNYFVSDTNYGWGPESIGDRTDIGNWWEWFRGPQSSTFMTALYSLGDQNSEYDRLTTTPAGENEIVMFKSCFTNSVLTGNISDAVPAINNNPLAGQDVGSGYMTIANAKGIYIDILEYFRSRQDKLFVVITAPPQTDPTYAAATRAFNQWLVNDWLKDYPYRNVAVFDFYNVLTTNGGSATTNDLNLASGNHHRWYNNAIQHKIDGDNDADPNVLEYPSDDDHPSQAGNLKATSEFVPLLNIYYNCWKNTGGCPGGTTPTPTPTPTPTQLGKRADFNGDGKSDILWHNNTTGQVAIWLMNGSTISSVDFPATVSDPSWLIKDVGDFNGDGKSDILWHNNTTGEVVIWTMNGGTIAASGSPATVSDPNWHIGKVGDFNGDGKSDILWYNSAAGHVAVWIMNGPAIVSGGFPAIVSDFNWQIRTVGDFDGDGKTDILWQNTATGQLVVWLISGTAIVGSGSPGSVPSPWKVVDAGDFDGNRKDDILWQNTSTGEVAIWFMNGSTPASSGLVSIVPSPWQFKGVRDFNGDTRADILWQNQSTGQVAIWLMSGTTISNGGIPAAIMPPWEIKY
ncbi:MAG: VCBS repeat-containing protein [Nitrospirae bacterium]|nr:VCBS repeat-containing protein [Nitrospirota bacterium]